MIQFINFKYKTNNFDDIMTQFDKINNTIYKKSMTQFFKISSIKMT